ncbi:hypothetical protein EGR_00553 [Echinococcus granulosus]|uniref:Uncharacterized protein n=1 Tax=Echinococcus granulosus TaxID=6210 RepID=W6UTH8_ECHGR|nr:hypothetical protein EGR_00553 [Echinococcus granulosus]EUB64603.1 hypothetical protein EGR_00553 [Echinococcus granulosus]
MASDASFLMVYLQTAGLAWLSKVDAIFSPSAGARYRFSHPQHTSFFCHVKVLCLGMEIRAVVLQDQLIVLAGNASKNLICPCPVQSVRSWYLANTTFFVTNQQSSLADLNSKTFSDKLRDGLVTPKIRPNCIAYSPQPSGIALKVLAFYTALLKWLLPPQFVYRNYYNQLFTLKIRLRLKNIAATTFVIEITPLAQKMDRKFLLVQGPSKSKEDVWNYRRRTNFPVLFLIGGKCHNYAGLSKKWLQELKCNFNNGFYTLNLFHKSSYQCVMCH